MENSTPWSGDGENKFRVFLNTNTKLSTMTKMLKAIKTSNYAEITKCTKNKIIINFPYRLTEERRL